MQDLASEFSKIFRDDTLTAGGGGPLPHSTPSPAFGRGRGATPPPGVLRPGVGTQTLVPSTFQPWLRHCWKGEAVRIDNTGD